MYDGKGGTAGNKMPASMMTQANLIESGGVKAFNHKLAGFQEHMKENHIWGQFAAFGRSIIRDARKDPNILQCMKIDALLGVKKLKYF